MFKLREGEWYHLNSLKGEYLEDYVDNISSFMVHAIYDSNDANVFVRYPSRSEMYSLRVDLEADQKWYENDSRLVSFHNSVRNCYRSELSEISEKVKENYYEKNKTGSC